MNKVSAMFNYVESKISLRNNESDLADEGPRICYALMITVVGKRGCGQAVLLP